MKSPNALRELPPHVAQASRIYLLPNLMTAGNLFCGFVAVTMCIQAHFEIRAGEGLTSVAAGFFTRAVWFILAAIFFDMLDGRLARLGGRESLFGAEFDSLADVVSFGLAPAMMVSYLIVSPTQGYPMFRQVGFMLAFIYLLCAAVRLARFNVITNPLLHRADKSSNKDFVGLPVPAAAGTVAALVLFLLKLAEMERELHRWALALPPLLLLIAVLMVSTVRYPSFKQVDWRTRVRLQNLVVVLGVLAAVVMLRPYSLLALMLCYIGYGLWRHMQHVRRWRQQRAAHASAAGGPTSL